MRDKYKESLKRKGLYNIFLFIRAFLLTMFLIGVTLLVTGCSSKLLQQAPVLAIEERVFKFTEYVGVISHNRCEKLNGENAIERRCTKTFYDINRMWNVFYPGHIIIPMKKVFR